MNGMEAMKGDVGATVGALRGAYGNLTQNARLVRDGYTQKLAGAIRARCAISREGARRQVQTFFDSYDSYKS